MNCMLQGGSEKNIAPSIAVKEKIFGDKVMVKKPTLTKL